MFRSFFALVVGVLVVGVLVVGVLVVGGGAAVAGGAVPSGYPDASTTGPVDESKIPETASGQVVTSSDGQILENIHVESLIIKHHNVTVRNFRVTRSDPDAWFAITMLPDPDTGESPKGTIIEDGEITSRDSEGNYQPSGAVGIAGSHFEARRLDISYMEDGVSGAEYLVEDSYIHDLIEYNGAHNDGIATYGGSNIVIRHNTISLPDQQTGAVSLFTDFKPIDNVLIENNYLNGGAYTIYSDDKDVGYGAPTNVTITGNAFGHDFIYGIMSADGAPAWTNNTWADTGQQIDETGAGIGPVVNLVPSAVFSSSCDDLLCAFLDGSADSDGSVVGWSWSFGDGSVSTVQDPSHMYLTGGSYTVSLTVTDDDGATDTVASTVTVSEPDDGAGVLHIADLDASGAMIDARWWTIEVTAMVVDSSGVPISDATVIGQTNRGSIYSCTTDETGTCNISIETRRRTETFVITGIDHLTATYDPSLNDDPEDDSDGTVISIARP